MSVKTKFKFWLYFKREIADPEVQGNCYMRNRLFWLLSKIKKLSLKNSLQASFQSRVNEAQNHHECEVFGEMSQFTLILFTFSLIVCEKCVCTDKLFELDQYLLLKQRKTINVDLHTIT